jgi:Fur family ferric uptake transcriptional regulator
VAEAAGGTVRSTRQRAMVREQLGRSDAFRSAQDVFSELRARGEGVGLSTVYRHLQALSAAGDADMVRTDAGESLYRLCGQDNRHHHHLVCRRCGLAVEIEGRSVERWAEKVAEESGFVQVEHTFELRGLCADCGRAARS